MKFGSWTYDGTKVDLGFFDDLAEVDITDYMPSNEWKLLGHPAKKNVKVANINFYRAIITDCAIQKDENRVNSHAFIYLTAVVRNMEHFTETLYTVGFKCNKVMITGM